MSKAEPDTMAGILHPPVRLASPDGYGRVVDFPKSPDMIQMSPGLYVIQQ